jgi:hypothetical protein
MGQVGLQILQGQGMLATSGVGQPRSRNLLPVGRAADDHAVEHGDQALPVLVGTVQFFQVAQHARNDVARCCGLKEQPQRQVVGL